jgi:ABC-type multidrug transport system ATPase subunit
VLELKDITFTIDKNGEDQDLIHKATLTVPNRHFMAIVGPSGCGKTTLLKIIAGLNEETDGSILWEGRNLAEDGDMEPNQIGYVPQFSIAYDHLTVEENVDSAVRIRVKTGSRDEAHAITDRVLQQTGMEAIRDSFVKVLSGGQKRRLGLALELVSNPTLLLCDEVTSGLDPKSEQEIVQLMHELSKSQRIVINVTHSLSNLELYDSVLVLFEGHVVYHGPPKAMPHYFSVEAAEDIYPRLSKRSASNWHASWQKHGEAYTSAAQAEAAPSPKTEHLRKKTAPLTDTPHETPDTPGRFTQFLALFARRWKIFFRDRTQLILQLAMLFGFPFLVIIFGLEGIEPLKQLSQSQSDNIVTELSQRGDVAAQHLKTGSLISGLIMFQVILLTLMGSNNSAREVASERLIFEKEKFGGLHPSSYLLSKICFLAVLVIVQAVWMGLFVQMFIPQLPGDPIMRVLLLVLVNGAMTAVCLGISSMMRSPEQSSLLSVYLVGFQLPLSGAVLALPDKIEPFTQPFISAFWSWSGNLDAMKTGAFSQAVTRVTEDTSMQSINICLLVLGIHCIVGIIIAYFGCRKHMWE